MIELINVQATLKEPPPSGDIVLRFEASTSPVDFTITSSGVTGSVRLSNGDVTPMGQYSTVIKMPAGVDGATVNARKLSGFDNVTMRISTINLLEIVDWVGLDIPSITFTNSTKLSKVPAVFPKSLTKCDDMFYNCPLLNDPNISLWDVSRVVSMYSMFGSCTSFNQNLNEWNTSNVTNIRTMFMSATVYNQPMNKWNVGKIVHLTNFVTYCNSFNQNLSNWVFVGFPITEQGIASTPAWAAANKPKFIN